MLDIVIVNWNTGKQLRDCLRSISDFRMDEVPLGRIVVVDNASTDGSADDIGAIGGIDILLIRNTSNIGFAAACNKGARGSCASYLLFLNPDTRLCKDSLRIPLLFMKRKENRHVGICGIQLVNDDGKVSRSCARFPTVGIFLSRVFGLERIAPNYFPGHYMTEWSHEKNRLVDQVMGAFFLMRRSLFESLGGFDERFFLYFEEVDLSLRARRKGWLTIYLAEAQIYHKGGGSSEQVKAERLFQVLRSRILYGYKHFADWEGHVLLVATLVIEPVSRIFYAAKSGLFPRVPQTIKAFLMLWSKMPGILKRARSSKDQRSSRVRGTIRRGLF